MNNASRYLLTATGKILLLFLAFSLLHCAPEHGLPPADPDNGGLLLPDGFEAVVVIDSVPGKVRHLAVNENGDIYAKIRFSDEKGGMVALRDNDYDGKADEIEKFGKYPHEGKWSLQTGARIYNGYLYFTTELEVFRMKLPRWGLVPTGEMELVIKDDHEHGRHEHIAKPITFDNQGHIYVPFGAPSNACQEPKRTPEKPGLDPCPQLEDHAGIWRFDANKLNQTQKDGYKYATGIRSVVGLDWNFQDNELYVVLHGRDDLLRLWPKVYSPWQSAVLPAEEFVRATEGSNFGWPYCYYDQIQGKKVLGPEYGGDGIKVERCADFDDPLIGFPGHWAPNDLLFYTGDMFPERYKSGAFIAFHGSTNRAPYPQSGYFVAFVPFEGGNPTGDWEIFADGFAGVDPIVSVSDAVYRPMGLAMGPDGSLYIGDTEKGKIWRVMYKGEKAAFGSNELAAMEARKKMSHIRTPDQIEDNLQREEINPGALTYLRYCGICHQANGEGASGRFPPLKGTDWVTGDKERLIDIVLNGREEAMEVNGETYTNAMPQHSFLSDKELAAVLTYIRSSFGNEAEAVTEQEVKKVRGR